jgi:hypothetical protein
VVPEAAITTTTQQLQQNYFRSSLHLTVPCLQAKRQLYESNDKNVLKICGTNQQHTLKQPHLSGNVQSTHLINNRSEKHHRQAGLRTVVSTMTA